jgi:pimeloyl-ACP methyl ester carboxylesterase
VHLPVIATDEAPLAEGELRTTETGRLDGLLDVNGHQIYLSCVGTGSPTVVLESGGNDPAAPWFAIEHAVAPFTRVCAYDRPNTAGGASDPVPTPVTAQDAVDDLHALLAAANVPGPYVLVGHSLGGLINRLFASTYPDEVAGLVLVEGAPPGWNIVDLTLAPLPEAEREGLRQEVAGREPPVPTSPIDYLVSEAQVLAAPPPPAVPTVMVVAGKAALFPVEGIAMVGDLEGAARFYLLQAGQARDLGARIVVAEESGHLVPFDQPEVMIAAIEDVVQAVHDPSRWVTSGAATPSP